MLSQEETTNLFPGAFAFTFDFETALITFYVYCFSGLAMFDFFFDTTAVYDSIDWFTKQNELVYMLCVDFRCAEHI